MDDVRQKLEEIGRAERRLAELEEEQRSDLEKVKRIERRLLWLERASLFALWLQRVAKPPLALYCFYLFMGARTLGETLGFFFCTVYCALTSVVWWIAER